jgi:seryl-tRNA synthetase
MLDIQYIRANPDAVRAAIRNKGFELDLDELLAADQARREVIARLEATRARRNEVAALIPKAAPQDRPSLVAEGKQLKVDLDALEPALHEAERRFGDLMLRVPSVPRPEVPVGRGEADNVEVRRVGTPRAFDFEPRDHVALATALGLVNWDGPRRFAGGRSYALVREGALLELAVVRLTIDTLLERGLSLVVPPVLVRESALTGTGFFPLGRDEAYAMPADELYLVGTSEVPLVSLHADTTLEADALPIRYAGVSPCFRREAGAHGKDTRGLYRVHQFTKVEQVVFCAPDEAVAEAEHYQLLANAEAVLAKLEIPYRVALACTGEIGLGQTRKHEVESWMPSRQAGESQAGRPGAYAETHSCSTLGDFQARRSRVRVRLPDGSLGYPYTLNNTAIASPRILIPLLENHQNADGSVTLPRALVPYMNGLETLRPRTPAAR